MAKICVLDLVIGLGLGLGLGMACSPSSAPPSGAEPAAAGLSPPAADPLAMSSPIRLTQGTFDADGSRVAAAWEVPPRNRAGTDGSTAVGVWDLESGETAVLPGATGPVALSPDGATLLVSLPTQPSSAAARGAPMSVALVPFGDQEPSHRLVLPPGAPGGSAPRGPLVAATFSLDGDRVLALTWAGALVRWTRAEPETPEVVDTLPDEIRPSHWQAASMAFDAAGDRLVLVALPADADATQARAFVCTWVVDGPTGRLSRDRAEEVGVVDGIPVGLAIAPLAIEQRRAEGQTTTIEPSGARTVRTTSVPVLEPAFLARDGHRRVTSDPAGGLRVELDDARGFALVPNTPAGHDDADPR